jgi:hypothetical protein
MRSLKLMALSVIAVLTSFVYAGSQSQEAKDTRPGTIAGRVSLGDKAARGVIVMLTPSLAESQMNMMNMFEQKAVTKAMTDEEGGYRFTNVAAGRYHIAPFAPALVAAGESSGRTINLGAGESLEKVDFSLARGGVITGRIMGADGKPVVAETVKITNVESPDKPKENSAPGFTMPDSKFMTDDRGVYRVYGLPAGRYLVSLGAPAQIPGASIKARYNAETFHPGVTDKAKATFVELSEGGEVTGIDIRLGLPSKTFKASGRIIDANTGKPVTGIIANYGATGGGEDKSVLSLGSVTNSKGEFKFDLLVPGSYSAYAMPDENSDLYSDMISFEVKDADITGLEVKLRRGTSIGGIVAVEGTDDPAILSSLSELQLIAITREPENTAPRFTTARIGGDGSFRLRGLQPGKVRIGLNRFFTPTKLDLLRVERNGVNQAEGIAVSQGENISDVRVVLSYAGAVLRGQVTVTNGTVGDDMTLEAVVVRAGSFGDDRRADVDANGRFVVEDLLPGTYEVTLIAAKAGADTPTSIKQTVTVANGAENLVTLTLDLKKKEDK